MSSSDDTTKIKRKLSTLTSSLHNLETNLAELLSQSLPELVLGLDTIQQAKLQVVIPYLLYDLVFVYLKTRGLDPKTHPVIAELDRVRQYFDKIKDAEDPAKRQLAVDKAAATRFIKNAIAQAKDPKPTKVSGPATHIRFDNDEDAHADGRAHDVRVPAKVTEKMLEREKYHEALREDDAAASEDDGGDLQVIDDEEPNDADANRLPSYNASSPSPPQAQASEFEATALNKDKGKGKAKEAAGIPIPPDVPPSSETAAGKRRRPAIDLFAGYGNGPDTRSSVAFTETGSTPGAARSGAKVQRVHIEDISAEASSGTNTPRAGGEQKDKVKKSRGRSKNGQSRDPV